MKFIKSFLTFSIILTFTLVAMNQVKVYANEGEGEGTTSGETGEGAADTSTLQKDLKKAVKGTGLPNFEGRGRHPDAPYYRGVSNIASAVLFITDLVKWGLGSIAVIFLIIAALKIILAGKDIEEAITKQKDTIQYASIGLLMIVLADVAVRQVFFGEGEVFEYGKEGVVEYAARGAAEIRGLYNFAEIFVAGIAILTIIFSGMQMIVMGSEEETLSTQTKKIIYACVGLIVVGISEFVVKDIVFPMEGKVPMDVEQAKLLIKNLTNFVASFIGALSILGLIYGGYTYIVDLGKGESPEKAKKIIFGSLMGMLLAIMAYAIVSTVITLDADTVSTKTVERYFE